MPISNKEKIVLSYPLGKVPDSLIEQQINNPKINRKYIAYIRKKHKILPPNGLYLFQEGSVCVSKYEAMYDVYLHENEIPHIHQITLKEYGLKLRPDFFVNNAYYVEIVGMSGYFKYDEKLALKKRVYKDNNIPVIYVEPQKVEVLYNLCNKYRVIYRYKRTCQMCGKEKTDLVNGVCRGSCSSKLWRKTSANTISVCKQCKKTFNSYSKNNRIFCTHECYSKSLKNESIPSEEWCLEQLNCRSLRSIAVEYGIKPSTLYMRIRRFKERRKL